MCVCWRVCDVIRQLVTWPLVLNSQVAIPLLRLCSIKKYIKIKLYSLVLHTKHLLNNKYVSLHNIRTISTSDYFLLKRSCTNNIILYSYYVSQHQQKKGTHIIARSTFFCNTYYIIETATIINYYYFTIR